MSQKNHYFVAVRLPHETKLVLKQTCDRLKEFLSFGRWVHHEDYHITLAFLGGAPEEQLHRTREFVQQAVQGHASLSLVIDHLGFFGRKDSPRIFWAGLKKAVPLYELRDDVFSACTSAGFQLETRPFSPHITLARKWMGAAPYTAASANGENTPEIKPVSFTANEVVLYQSHLDRTPKYEAIAVFPLIRE